MRCCAVRERTTTRTRIGGGGDVQPHVPVGVDDPAEVVGEEPLDLAEEAGVGLDLGLGDGCRLPRAVGALGPWSLADRQPQPPRKEERRGGAHSRIGQPLSGHRPLVRSVAEALGKRSRRGLGDAVGELLGVGLIAAMALGPSAQELVEIAAGHARWSPSCCLRILRALWTRQ